MGEQNLQESVNLATEKKLLHSLKCEIYYHPHTEKEKTKTNPEHVKTLLNTSKTSMVCVSILRLFNINWFYLTPHVSTEGMSS